MRAHVNGLELEYEVRGTEGPWLLLVMGLGQQLVAWPEPLVDGLVEAGFRVLRFDHRDTGLSSKTAERGISLEQAFALKGAGGLVPAPYDLEDLVDDAFGVLDAAGAEQAHVVGISMGGMVAQLMAIRRPDRVASLTSMMSTTGEAHLPPATPAAMGTIVGARPSGPSREARIAHGLKTKKVLAGPLYPTPDEELEAMIARAVDRMWHPAGIYLHTLAVLATGGRVERLRRLSVPTLVLHGEDDPLVPPAHGRRTAEVIPEARFIGFPGWGHDLPPGMTPHLVKAIREHAQRS